MNNLANTLEKNISAINDNVHSVSTKVNIEAVDQLVFTESTNAVYNPPLISNIGVFDGDTSSSINGLTPTYLTLKNNAHTLDKGKHVQSFSVKVLNWDEQTVKTEWLLSKEEGKYQVRHFPIEVFENKEHLLEHGHFLKAFLYISSGQMTIEFVDGIDLVPKTDFPDDYMLKEEDFSLFKLK